MGLHFLAVAPKLRGSGCGSYLLKLLARRAYEEGAGYIQLDSLEQSIEFYKKFGFCLAGFENVMVLQVPVGEFI